MKKKLLTILLSVFVMMTAFTTRVFAATFSTSGEILGTVTNAFSWINESGKEFVEIIGPELDTQTVSTSDNLNYTFNWNSITFTLETDGTTLISITLAGCTPDIYDGTYRDPATISTISAILATNPNFPTSSGSTPPTNAWLCEAATEAWQDADKLYVNTPFGVDENLPKTVPIFKEGNNYKFINTFEGYELLFVMDSSGKFSQLKVIVDLGEVITITYEPLGDRKTVANFLENYAPDFPETEGNGWVNSNNSSIGIYKNEDNGISFYGDDMLNSIVIEAQYLLSPSNSNYVISLFGMEFTFEISDNKLQCIHIVYPMLSLIEGTYSAPKTIANILDTVSGGFPTTQSSGWVDQNGNRAFINSNNIQIINDNVPLNTVLTKDGNNYKYEYDTGLYYVFNIESGVLASITETNNNCIFVPYQYKESPTSKPVGYTGDLVFITNAHYNGDPSTVNVYIKLQGQSKELLDADNYILEQGSTKVTLKGSYVKTLPAGTHTITIGVTGYDDAAQDFIITAAPSPTPGSTPRYVIPNTGVEGTLTNNHSLLKLSSLSLLAIGIYMVIKNKEDNQ